MKHLVHFSIIITSIILFTTSAHSQPIQLVSEVIEGAEDGISPSNANILSKIVNSIVWVDERNDVRSTYFTNGNTYETTQIYPSYDTNDPAISDFVLYQDKLYCSIYEPESRERDLISIDDNGEIEVLIDGMSNLRDFELWNDRLYFLGGTGNLFDINLYCYDFSIDFELLKITTSSANIVDMEVFNDELYMLTFDSFDRFLRKTDAEGFNIETIQEFGSGSFSSTKTNMTVLGDQLLFWIRDGEFTYPLYATDGTAAGTERLFTELSNLSTHDFDNNRSIQIFNDQLFFRGSTNGNAGNSVVYVTDGTSTGTMALDLADVEFETPSFFTLYNDQLYFEADLGFIEGTNMFRIDAAGNAGPALDKSLVGSGYRFDGIGLTEHNGRLYYVAVSDNGGELWTSDGTEASTFEVMDLVPGAESSLIFELTSAGENLFFFADTPETGRELFVFTSNIISNTEDIDINQNEALLIFPNPAQDYIEVSNADHNIEQINITDTAGKAYDLKFVLNQSSIGIDIRSLPSGVYLLNSDDGRVGKFIKQ